MNSDELIYIKNFLVDKFKFLLKVIVLVLFVLIIFLSFPAQLFMWFFGRYSWEYTEPFCQINKDYRCVIEDIKRWGK